ncbi:inositol monophosphatase family protein [Rhodococcus sp. SGAir0479]|uniref:inositol monophosphatase family protein n=1 Tax=Rhodococcus sp. SGAir0479 TaxID=2567884 RepID=UPI0010CD2E67|nr:inositol monophosphatase family protein [Rhodococcus sp. SGAir0479]QCQ90826.1 inositol monophosphatase [Rhodococcus sp. SGAir0479]
MRATDSSTAGRSVPTDPVVLREVAVTVAEAAAALVRERRPEVFGEMGAPRRGSDAGNTGDAANAGDSENAAASEDSAVRSKSTPTDPVTVVDTEAEHFVRARLAYLRPHDGILGEEGGGDEAVEGVRWVVDPIDGTVNFLYGIPAYAVSVAAQVDGISVAGAVVDVAAGVTYSAAVGEGASYTGADGSSGVLSCNPVTDASFTLLATGFAYDAERRRQQGRLIGALLPHVRDIRRIGSAALDLCMVASGRVDAHFEHGLNPWDWAAGALIAQEAGARVHVPAPDTRGDAGAVVIAMAPGIADEFEAVFRSVGGFDPIR